MSSISSTELESSSAVKIITPLQKRFRFFLYESMQVLLKVNDGSLNFLYFLSSRLWHFFRLYEVYLILVLKEALKSCRGTPLIITDQAPWYKYAFESLKLDYIKGTFGVRNYIEKVV